MQLWMPSPLASALRPEPSMCCASWRILNLSNACPHQASRLSFKLSDKRQH